MNIVYMNGGLGNQMFQYVLFRWLELVTNEKCIIDNAPFYLDNVPHNGYELNKIFGLKPLMLSNAFDEDVWQHMLNSREQGVWGVAQQLLDAGLPIVVALEPNIKNIKFNGSIIPADFIPIEREGKHIYYHGYWIGSNFFMDIQQKIIKDFSFPKIKDKQNKKYVKLIEKSIVSSAIHIRRGDMAKLGRSCTPEHFSKAIDYSEQHWQVNRYFLFSDDLKWCETHADELGLNKIKQRLFVIDANSGENAYRDMQLMSMCQHRISDHSAFSLMAWLLCPYANKQDISNWL